MKIYLGNLINIQHTTNVNPNNEQNMFKYILFDLCLFILILNINSFFCKKLHINVNPYKYKCLDAVRGICAVLVVFHHLYFRTGNPDNQQYWSIFNYQGLTRMYISWLGTLGVSIFFIISGFLFFPVAQKGSNIVTFLTKRFFRIYPPILFSLILVFIALIITNNFTLSPCAYKVFKYMPTPFGLLDNGPVCGYTRGNLNAGVLWTIVWEIRLYLFIPLLMLLLKLIKNQWIVITGLLILCITLYLLAILDYSELSYLLFFVIGFICSILQDKKIPYLATLFFTGLILSVSTIFITGTYYNPLLPLTLMPSFLAIIKGYSLFNLLENEKLKLLGVTSFTIYLNHGVFQFLSKYYLFQYDTLLWQLVACIAVATCSPFLYKYIEYRCKNIAYIPPRNRV